jgi:hypothetical protein
MRSSMSMLLSLQLYVAYILSTDPSHLENAASTYYTSSRVRFSSRTISSVDIMN